MGKLLYILGTYYGVLHEILTHPTENRNLPQGRMGCICALSLSFVFIPHVVERKLRQDQQTARSR